MNTPLLLAIVASVLLVIGFIGTIVPILPGVPLAWIGLFVAHFCEYSKVSVLILVITGIFMVIVSVADNILPSVFTKKAGGSKAGVTGSIIGMIIGFFINPLCMIIGAFIGAFVGELIGNPICKGENKNLLVAFRSAFASFLGFILSTGLKMATSLAFIWIFAFTIIF